MKALLTYLFLVPWAVFAQCPNDLCEDAIEAPECLYVDFCTTDCNHDFVDNMMDDGVGTGGFTSCHAQNYDLWYYFDYPDTADGYLMLRINGGDCYNAAAGSSSYGRNEGWAFMLWAGDYCDFSQIVWGTNCYWLTDNYPDEIQMYFGVGDYDPTRQLWNIMILDAEPGERYWVQIDGFGWCRGCASFQWCSSPSALEITYDTDTVIIDEIEEMTPARIHDILGRRIR